MQSRLLKYPFAHTVQEVLPFPLSKPNTGLRNQETAHSRIGEAAGKGDATSLTAFAIATAIEIFVEVPVTWLLRTTALVLQDRNPSGLPAGLYKESRVHNNCEIYQRK